jgi:hypothetical protein
MIDSGPWTITEFPDAVKLDQIGIEIIIWYKWNGIDQEITDQDHQATDSATPVTPAQIERANGGTWMK